MSWICFKICRVYQNLGEVVEIQDAWEVESFFGGACWQRYSLHLAKLKAELEVVRVHVSFVGWEKKQRPIFSRNVKWPNCSLSKMNWDVCWKLGALPIWKFSRVLLKLPRWYWKTNCFLQTFFTGYETSVMKSYIMEGRIYFSLLKPSMKLLKILCKLLPTGERSRSLLNLVNGSHLQKARWRLIQMWHFKKARRGL